MGKHMEDSLDLKNNLKKDIEEMQKMINEYQKLYAELKQAD